MRCPLALRAPRAGGLPEYTPTSRRTETRDRIDHIYSEHTGRPLEEVHRDMERDRFFTPEQAEEYGLIDRIIEHRWSAS